MARWSRAVLGAVLCLALAGCTDPAPDPGAPASTGFHLAQIEGARFAQASTAEVVRVGSPPPNGFEWHVAAVDPAASRVMISWTDGGSLRCGMADRVEVQETAQAVVIGVAATHRDPDLLCTAEGHGRTIGVPLRKPLGARALMEASSGANDGLSTVSDPATLPAPTCSSDVPSDVPVGMLDVTTRMAPRAATKAFICRTWWPRGIAHDRATTVTDRAAVARLVASVNAGATDVHAGGDATVPCPTRLKGSWYDVYLEGPGLRVSVKVDEISCQTITNGAIIGRLTPALAATLDALFPA